MFSISTQQAFMQEVFPLKKFVFFWFLYEKIPILKFKSLYKHYFLTIKLYHSW